MYLSELLSSIKPCMDKKVKLVLYKSLPDVSEGKYLVRFQNVLTFENCEFILVFSEMQSRHALFIGAYKKIGIINYDKTPESMEYPYPRLCDSYYHFYQFEKIDLMEERIHHLVIYWGYRKPIRKLRRKNAKILS